MMREAMSNGKNNELLGALSHMKRNGSLKIVVIGLVLGLGLLIVGSLGIFDGDDEEQTVEEERGYTDYLEYKKMLEEEIGQLCLSVSGVESVRAVVFFDGIGGSVYAQNTQSGSAGDRSEYVIIGSGSGSHALYLGESLPTLSGIGVVCRTGGSAERQSELAILLSSAYGLPLNRVYIAEAD